MKSLQSSIRAWAIAFSVAAALSISSETLAQETNEAARVAAAAGCYAIEFGPWLPDMGQNASNDGIFLIPPGEVALTTVPSGHGSARYVLRPAPGVAPSVHRVMLWGVKPPNNIELTFSNGFSGFTVSVARDGDVLVGQAVSFWDFPRPSQKASAVLHRIPCRE